MWIVVSLALWPEAAGTGFQHSVTPSAREVVIDYGWMDGWMEIMLVLSYLGPIFEKSALRLSQQLQSSCQLIKAKEDN